MVFLSALFKKRQRWQFIFAIDKYRYKSFLQRSGMRHMHMHATHKMQTVTNFVFRVIIAFSHRLMAYCLKAPSKRIIAGLSEAGVVLKGEQDRLPWKAAEQKD